MRNNDTKVEFIPDPKRIVKKELNCYIEYNNGYNYILSRCQVDENYIPAKVVFDYEE